MRYAQLAVAAWLAFAAPLFAYEKGDEVNVIASPRTKADDAGISYFYGTPLRIIAVEGDRLRVLMTKVGTVAKSEVITKGDAL